MSPPSAGGPPPTVALTTIWSSLGSLADGGPEPDVAILPLCRVCPTTRCVPPPYREHALVAPPRRRTAALANSFPSGPAPPVGPWSVPVISRVQAASPALLDTSRPQRQCRIHLAS
ncbi:MAG: hypothetical protein ACK56F_12630, partial [bacterium]